MKVFERKVMSNLISAVGKINGGTLARTVVAGRGSKESILKGLAHSGLSGPLRSIVMNMLGKQERARFYLTHIESGEKFQFSMTPEEVNVKTSSSFRSFNVIEKGEVKIPKGEELTGVSWNGILPGENASSYKFIDKKSWREPKEIIKQLTRWRENGDKLKVLVTQTPINLDVYIRDFDSKYVGGQGNVKYTINLIVAKTMQVKTVEEVDAERKAAEEAQKNKLNERPAMKKNSETVIKASENFWTIAEAFLGGGSDWTSIFALNPTSSGDPTDVIPGTTIHLPDAIKH